MTISTMKRSLRSLLVVGVLGSVGALGIFGSFSATTSSSGNEIQSGNVAIGDNDAGSALYTLSAAKPGDSLTKCIKVTYNGSVNADVHLYSATATLGALAPYINLKITQGTQSTSTFPSCTGFTPISNSQASDGVMFSGTLAAFAAGHNSYANGLDFDPLNDSVAWNTGDSVVYQVQVTLDATAPSSAESQTTGPTSFVWEAQDILNGQ